MRPQTPSIPPATRGFSKWRFLRTRPAPKRYPVSTRSVRADAFAVRGRNVYLHYPNGVARSKLTNEYLSAQLQTASTMRNWRTVLTLLEMIDAP